MITKGKVGILESALLSSSPKLAAAVRSTKCWCFIEFEDIRAGQQALELYKKPTIMDTAEKRLKNVKLHTIKPLFLHVDLKLRA